MDIDRAYTIIVVGNIYENDAYVELQQLGAQNTKVSVV